MLLAPSIPLPLFVLICSILAEAKSNMRSTPKDVNLKVLQVKQQSVDNKAHISPELEPESSEKFFKKDYPYDKRPAANPFHFNHPYPVVQDSNEFDADFVKDENSDNGSWKAQETYDRLRSKLAKEKKQLAKALAKKLGEENEMREAMQRHQKEQRDRQVAADKVARIKRDQEKDRRDRKAMEERQEEEEEVHKLPFPLPGQKKKPAEDKAEAEDVDVSTEETEKAMKKLEECKKQLAEARQRLKELMKELEDAKASQNAANAALDEAMKKELVSKEHHAKLKKEVQSEYQDYMEAKKNYEQQQANVEKLEAQIKVAAAKVKALRDGADADGGVYPTPDQRRSSAPAGRLAFALVPALAAALAFA